MFRSFLPARVSFCQAPDRTCLTMAATRRHCAIPLATVVCMCGERRPHGRSSLPPIDGGEDGGRTRSVLPRSPAAISPLRRSCLTSTPCGCGDPLSGHVPQETTPAYGTASSSPMAPVTLTPLRARQREDGGGGGSAPASQAFPQPRSALPLGTVALSPLRGVTVVAVAAELLPWQRGGTRLAAARAEWRFASGAGQIIDVALPPSLPSARRGRPCATATATATVAVARGPQPRGHKFHRRSPQPTCHERGL